MKKKLIIIISIIFAIIIIIAGSFALQKFIKKVNLIRLVVSEKTTEKVTENETVFHKEFGSSELPKNWVESKKYSTKEKFFYVLKGQEENKQPNNIAVNSGINKYSKEEHEKFRKAILNQLFLQIGNRKGIEINANGSTTESGEIVYTFIM